MGGAITTDAAARYTTSLLLCLVVIGMLLPLVTMAPAAAMVTTGPICLRDGCNCTTTGNYWIRANCSFKSHQTIEIEANSLPAELLELEVNTCKELNLLEGAFSRLQALQRVRLRHVGHLRVRRHAFYSLAAKHTLLDVYDCDSAVIETHAFRAVQGPLTVVVSRCGHVVIQSMAFSWSLAITVTDIARLELAEKAFSFEKPRATFESNRRPGYNHGPATKVLLQNVILADIPSFTFPTSAAELRLVNVEVRMIRQDAFSALQLSAVIIQNSSLHRIESGAFSERTFIENLEMTSVRVRHLEANAILGAIQHLTIQHSRFVEVVGGAINVTVALVTISNNVFEQIRGRAFIFKAWNRLILDSNIFQKTELEAFSIEFNFYDSSNVFAFTSNEVDTFGPGAFSFVAEALEVGVKLDARVYGNRFMKSCNCKLGDWINETVTASKGSQDTVEWFVNTSFCTVGSLLLAKCFNVPQGFVSMNNFTELVCGSANVIVCEDASQSDIVTSVLRDINNQVPTAINTTYESELDREKKVLGLIFLVVVTGMATIVMVTMLMWMKRKGYCVQVKIMLLPSTTSCLTMFHRLFGSFRGGGGNGIVAAGSISRLPVHEYTEIQQQQQRQLTATMLIMDEGSDGEVENEYVPCAEKWTQTLPEELTQELLQSLREKLDDPENYSEARDMIEHLYDLIKVEESCSNNNTPSTSDTMEVYDDDEEEEGNLYDVIQPPISTPAKRTKQQCNGRVKKSTCHVGTRAPSPDKLLPAATYAQIRRARHPDVVKEYAQPRDREPHQYTELPGGSPSVPLTPPAKPPPGPSPLPNRGPARPLSFLRALGESLLTVKTPSASHDKTKPITASLVCEYAEPTDATVHEYSELPITVKCTNKMANRPLPTKPDELNDPGEGPSTSSS